MLKPQPNLMRRFLATGNNNLWNRHNMNRSKLPRWHKMRECSFYQWDKEGSGY